MAEDDRSKRAIVGWRISEGKDPLAGPGPHSGASSPQALVDAPPKTRKANLTIRHEDETRIVSSLQDAGKKLTSGSLYTVVVDISRTGTLDIGVKDLTDNVLAISLLKRENNIPGSGEAAGLRLGDIIFGINFIPVREGSKTLITIVKLETEKKKRFLHIQGWRCHQLCSDAIPGYLFPRANDMFVHSYSLFRAKVFSEWERWNFVEILLSHMVDDLHMRTSEEHVDRSGENATGMARYKQMQVLDLEKNILQAKGLRTALNVRIVHTKNKDDAVVYVLRIEDVESGLHWISNRRYNEFHTLHEELVDISQFMKEVEFPKKKLALRNSIKLIESRIVALESFIRRALHLLTTYASMDALASKALRHLQRFLGVDQHIDCIHPPLVDDQRAIEMMAYRFLNDFNSPACQQCVRFTQSVDLESMMDTGAGEQGYKSLLSFMHDALNEVEQFVQQQHEQQLTLSLQSRRPEWDEEQCVKLVKQCIRRQVESSLYLPLRRVIFRLTQSYLAEKSKKFQRAISLLQQAKPSVFMVDDNVSRTKALPRCIQSFRKAMLAYLPVDFGQYLIEAAYSISELYAECRELRRTSSIYMKIKDEHQLRRQQSQSNSALGMTGMTRSGSPTSNGVGGGGGGSSSGDGEGMLSLAEQKDSLKLLRDLIVSSGNGGGSSSGGSITITATTESSTAVDSNSSSSSSSAVKKERRPSLKDRVKDYVECVDASKGQQGRHPSTSISHTSHTSHSSNSEEQSEDIIDAVDGAGSLRTSFTIPTTTTATTTGGATSTTGANGSMTTSSPARAMSMSGIPSSPAMTSSSAAASSSSSSTTTITMSQNKRLAFEAVETYLNNQVNNGNTSMIGSVSSVIVNSTSTTTESSITNSDRDVGSSGTDMIPPIPSSIPSVIPSIIPTDGNTSSTASTTSITTNTSTTNTNTTNTTTNTSTTNTTALPPPPPPRPSPSIKFSPPPATTTTTTTSSSTSISAKYFPPSSTGSSSGKSTGSLRRVSVRNEAVIDPLLRPPTMNTETQNRYSGNNVDEEVFAEVFSQFQERFDIQEDGSLTQLSAEEMMMKNAISADDFLPLFTYVVVFSQVPQMLLLKELMSSLISNEDTYGECGYYLATLEAAVEHINDLAGQYEGIAKTDGFYDDDEDIYEYSTFVQ